MSETLLLWAGYLVCGAMGAFYTERFLRIGRFPRGRERILWTGLYFLGQLLWDALFDAWPAARRWLPIPLNAALLFLLQAIFFVRDRAKQLFVVTSFLAGWEILKLAASPLAFLLLNAGGAALVRLANSEAFLSSGPPEEIGAFLKAAFGALNFTVLLLARGIQFGLFGAYLLLIARRFVGRDYELSASESRFLLLPCVTVLGIAFTVRLMLLPGENGFPELVYDRVPATTLLLPLTALLLSGVVVASVMLFRHLVQAKEEEQKRLLLENRVAEIHRELGELQDIYADMRGLRHDLSNHIASLAACARRLDPAEGGDMERYLARMAETVGRMDFAYRTGHPMTDVILHQAAQRAKREGVAFDAAFRWPAAFGFDVYDMSVILNNALQNALEAAGKIGGGVELRAYAKGSLFFVEVENDFAGTLLREDEESLPATTKEDRSLHGLGLMNIRRCAQKYRGDLDIETAEEEGRKRFRLTVMLYAGGGEKTG